MTKWYVYRFKDGYEYISTDYTEEEMQKITEAHGDLMSKIWIG